MSEDRPVILCFDGSECAGEAIATSGRLLAGRAAVVLCVVESLSTAVFHGAAGDATTPPDDGVQLHVSGLEQARRLAKEGVRLAEEAGFVATPLVDVTAEPASHRIARIADEHEAAVIVLGSRGRSTLKSIALGSTCHEVIQHAKLPVLVVKPTDAVAEG
jgi:nucleotide-binding universal stress UspA family protein